MRRGTPSLTEAGIALTPFKSSSQAKRKSGFEFGTIRRRFFCLAVFLHFLRFILFLLLLAGVVPQAKRAVPRRRHDLVLIGMPTDVADALAMIRKTRHDLSRQNVPNDDATRGAAGIHIPLTRRERGRKITSAAEREEERRTDIAIDQDY